MGKDMSPIITVTLAGFRPKDVAFEEVSRLPQHDIIDLTLNFLNEHSYYLNLLSKHFVITKATNRVRYSFGFLTEPKLIFVRRRSLTVGVVSNSVIDDNVSYLMGMSGLKDNGMAVQTLLHITDNGRHWQRTDTR